jgi:lycopene cyclase domain-containing protein
MGRWAYLVLLVAWTTPVLAGQPWILRRRYGEETARVLWAIVPPALAVSAWLAATDHLALRAGVWRLQPDRHLGPRVGVVPIEEILFFVVTNLLVAFGVALVEGFGTRRTA